MKIQRHIIRLLFTLMLAGRAKNIAPVLAQKVDLSKANCLLDIGGGTGVYSIAFLQRYLGQELTPIADQPPSPTIAV